MHARRLFTVRPTKIPAHHMAVVDTKIREAHPGPLPDWGMVVPAQRPLDTFGIVAAATLVDPQAISIPVMVANPTSEDVSLSPNQVLGIMHPVKHVSSSIVNFQDTSANGQGRSCRTGRE